MVNRDFASGDRIDSLADEKFIEEESSRTGFPGRNIKEEGLGVDCVWMNIDRFCCICCPKNR